MDVIGQMTRRCGDCQLCCKLLPVRELSKGAGERCRHQRVGKGCMIYHRLGMPSSCVLWTCQWLTNDDASDLRRPDRSHYVIDIMPEFVTMQFHETGESRQVAVVQVWIDPDFPDAHRDPQLRNYLTRRGREGVAAVIRYSSCDAFVLFPPPMTDGVTWHETPRQRATVEHTAAEVVTTLASLTKAAS